MAILHTAYIVHCDGCHKTLAGADGAPRTFFTNVAAIAAARSDGWLVNQKGCKDFCPDCARNIQSENQ